MSSRLASTEANVANETRREHRAWTNPSVASRHPGALRITGSAQTGSVSSRAGVVKATQVGAWSRP